MSTSKSKPKTVTSSVSKVKPTDTVTTSKTSSKTNPPVKPKEQSYATAPAANDSAKPSKFYFSCRNNEIDVVTSLLPTLTLEEINQIEPNGSTALHAAAYYGNLEIVKLLLSQGAQRMIQNRYGSTPYDEAKTEKIKKLFDRVDGDRAESSNRFGSKKGASFEWIFVKSDPSSYASFNRESLLKCRTDEEFDRLCRGIRQYYINESGPLADVENIEVVRSLIDRAIKENDPTLVVRAYTAETGFYTRINADLAQMPTHWSGSKHERNIASIMLFHPVFQDFSFIGETHRGMTMSTEDLKEYAVDSVFMNKTFLSTSKDRTRAELFAVSGKTPAAVGVVCKYSIKNNGTALTIETISEYPFEKEVLILPYALFRVKSIRKTGATTEIDVEEEDSVNWTSKKSAHASHTPTSVKKKTVDSEEDDDDPVKFTLKKSFHASNSHTSVNKKTVSSQEDDDDPVKWTSKKSVHASHTHTSVKKKTVVSQGDDDDSYANMFKDSQEKGKIDPADLAKWKQESFGIDPTTDTYAKMWNDAKKGKFSKSDVAKWKKESGIVTNDNDSDLESYDGENDPTIFTASNEQSYATTKKFTSKQPFDMKEFMTQFENDSDD